MSPPPNGVSKIRIIVRFALLVVLGLAILALVLDRQARSQAEMAFEHISRLADATEEDTLTPNDVQQKIGRQPTESGERLGGRIEQYLFYSAVPGRSYRVLVAYARNSEGEDRYVEHYLNEIDNDGWLEGAIFQRSSGVDSVPGQGGFLERLMSSDANGDGILSADELPEERAERMLDLGDANKDGALDGSELESMASQFRGRGGGRRGRGRGSSEDGEASDDVQRPERPQRPELESAQSTDE